MAEARWNLRCLEQREEAPCAILASEGSANLDSENQDGDLIHSAAKPSADVRGGRGLSGTLSAFRHVISKLS